MDINTIINHKYQITHLIGSGGFGEVYGATDLLLKRPVAVKILKLDVSNMQATAERFLKEAQLTSQLSHPHTLTIFEFGQFEGQFFIVSELLQGESLRQRLSRVGRYSPGQMISLFLPICSALHEAHQIGVIHRDLKPDNLFLHKAFDEERLILIDFGIAKSVGDVHLTQTGQVFGTPHYMAPEQIKEAKDVDARADIYSLGIIFFEALSGELPFNGDSLFEIFEAHIRSTLPKLSERLSKDYEPFDRLLAQMLTKAPQQRMSSAAEVAQALKELQNNISPQHLRSLPSVSSNSDTLKDDALKTGALAEPQSLPPIKTSLSEFITQTQHPQYQTTEILATAQLDDSTRSLGTKTAYQLHDTLAHEPESKGQEEVDLPSVQVSTVINKDNQKSLNTNLGTISLAHRLVKFSSFFAFSLALLWTGLAFLEEDQRHAETLKSSTEVLLEQQNTEEEQASIIQKEALEDTQSEASSSDVDSDSAKRAMIETAPPPVSESNKASSSILFDSEELDSESLTELPTPSLEPASPASPLNDKPINAVTTAPKPSQQVTSGAYPPQKALQKEPTVQKTVAKPTPEVAVQKDSISGLVTADKREQNTSSRSSKSSLKKKKKAKAPKQPKIKKTAFLGKTISSEKSSTRPKKSKKTSVDRSSLKSKSPKTKSRAKKSSKSKLSFDIFLKPKGAIKRGQSVKIKLRLKQGKAQVGDLKVSIMSKKVAKFTKKLKHQNAFKRLKSRTLGFLKAKSVGTTRLKVCLKTVCKNIDIKVSK